MRIPSFLAAAALLLALAPACSPEVPAPGKANDAPSATPQLEALSGEAADKAKAFGKALKGALMGAISKGGLTNAVEHCNTKAMPLAAEASDAGWTVARRSDRLRNPANEPDEWEAAQLDAFAQRIAQGEAPHAMEHAEIVEAGETRTFRYAKAIVMGGECLGCHGTKVSPEVVAKLDALYPEDKARGYSAGELRGMFSLSKSL